MKLIIAGGRHYKFTPRDIDFLNWFKRSSEENEDPITEVVSGKCSGADAYGERWAKFHGIHVEPFPADWDNLGDAAGPVRNEEMAKYADVVILFPGNKGTRSMQERAEIHGLTILFSREFKGIGKW